MKLKIDNLDGTGQRDYSPYVAMTPAPKIRRRLNRPTELQAVLISSTPEFVVPVDGARIVVEREDTGNKLFTGYLTRAPEFEYAGWGETGPVYRYHLQAESDEYALDRKVLPARTTMTGRSAGEVLRQMTNDLMAGAFDLSQVEDLDVIPSYGVKPQNTWSEHAAEIALLAGASYRAHDAGIIMRRLGAISYMLQENNGNGWQPSALRVTETGIEANDVLVVGEVEPRAHVKAYFIGDGGTLSFDLPEAPYLSSSQTLLEEEYSEEGLRETRWSVTDPAGAIGVSGGKLQVNGGTGIDGQTQVRFAEKIELGGALVLQHGDISFAAESEGVLGGLYPVTVTAAGCLAGFQISRAGGQSAIRALISGGATGATITTQAGHRYALTTRLCGSEIYRQRQRFHSSQGAAGGEEVACDTRVVLEVHDVDAGNPATLVAASTVLYDGVVSGAPAYCTYALVNSSDAHCAIAFTRIVRSSAVEVRSEVPGQDYRTRLTGSLSEGAECRVVSTGMYFFPQYAPASGEKIVVRYRGAGRAMARVVDAASAAAEQRPGDDGYRGAVKRVMLPVVRTSADCENAALMLLEDGTQRRESGECQLWSDMLPGGAADCFPGDALQLDLPSRRMTLHTIIREVEIEVFDGGQERSRYTIRMANEGSDPAGFRFEKATLQRIADVTAITKESAGASYLADVSGAEVTEVTSTTVTINTGCAPPSGGGFEARRTDYGWGEANDRNLAGRFSTTVFSLPRLSRAQEYYLRQYDGANPRRYSRYPTLLRVDYPL